MSLPIVYHPFVTTEIHHVDSFGQKWGVYYRRTKKTTQAKPFDRPLPYQMVSYDVRTFASEDNLYGPQLTNPEIFLQQEYFSGSPRAYNHAYKKLVEAIRQGEQVQTAMNLATAGMTVDLLKNTRVRVAKVVSIGGIAHLLGQFAEYLRRGQHRKAVGFLGKRVPPSVNKRLKRMRRAGQFRNYSRDISQEYLMFHFAWSPLFGDMFNALEFLAEGYTEAPVKVVKKSMRRYRRFRRIEGPYKHTYSQPDRVEKGEGYTTWNLGCEAQISDVPQFVLNRLGLVNPALVAWDLVPFSFVVGWLGNFEQCIAAPTDFFGVDIKNVYTTEFVNHDVRLDDSQWNYTTRRYARFTQQGKYQKMDRKVLDSFEIPSFQLANPFTSWRRAFAQISLLTIFGIKPSRARK